MNDVYVLGSDMIKFGRYPHKTTVQLGSQAALLALKDAGLTIHDVDVFYAASTFTAACWGSRSFAK
jgi:acetyl-CoA acyltransferase